MLTGQQALLKVQVTHCGDDQTMLGITIAQVLSGSPQCRVAAMLWLSNIQAFGLLIATALHMRLSRSTMASVKHKSTAEQGRVLVVHSPSCCICRPHRIS